MLARELHALSDAHLLSLKDASESELRTLVAKGEQLHLQGRDDEAAVVLLEALESPRFADFHDFDSYAAGEYVAAVSLLELGSRQSARRYLERVIARGPKDPYYGPAVRAFADVALALGDVPAASDWLAKQGPAGEDAQNELRYLRARALYDQGEHDRAVPVLEQVTKHSRFYASAQYLLGAIAAEQKNYKRAEQRFCAIADAGKDKRYAFYVDDRFFELQDLARLGLGRTAHEMHRADDAFYYYFQVPRDSKRLPDSWFEAAYATYEGQDHDTALDLLDQLQAQFPKSPYSDEAAILRGYVSLGRCEFEQADRYFVRFEQGFSPLVNELDRLIANPVRRRHLYDELIAAERGVPAETKAHETLLALLKVDPEFYRLHEQLRKLDAEAGRNGRLTDELEATRARVTGSDAPRALALEDSDEDDASEQLSRDVELAAQLSRSLADELDALRAAGAKTAQLTEIEHALAEAGRKLDGIEERAARLRATARAQAGTGTGANAKPASGLAAALDEDAKASRALPERVQAVREQVASAADASAEHALRALRERLYGMLRRARIGRIDAVMGSKRRIELQIESLAAGRFPPELRDPLRVQGLLNDDEEYWPFEGEDWPDEYQERYGADKNAGAGRDQ
jgi:tetratricopeptide (TPR) repeat protein